MAGFFSKLKNLFTGSDITDDFYEEIEEHLVMADCGIYTTERIIDSLKEKVKKNHIKSTAECKQALMESMAEQMFVPDDAYDFEELFAIPPDVKEEEQVDDEGNVIVPSCEDLQRAQNDLWIITQDTFKELKSGKIKIEDAIADWKQLQRQFGDEADDAFDCWPGWYMQNGSNEAILWLLDQALIRARELSVR